MTWGETELLGLLGTQPTGNGLHKYCAIGACPRKARLDAEVEHDGGKLVATEATFKMDVGTVFHELGERWHAGEDPEELPHDLPDHPTLGPVLREAWRLFDFYSGVFPAGFWGKVIAHEMKAQWPELDLGGRIDLVVAVDAAASSKVEAKLAQPFKPGVHVIDFKTHGQIDREQQMKDFYSLQAKLYPKALEVMRPDLAPVGGTTFVHVYRHAQLRAECEGPRKPRSYDISCVRRFPDEDVEAIFKQYVDRKKIAWQSGECELSQCLSGWEVCRHLLSGACNQR